MMWTETAEIALALLSTLGVVLATGMLVFVGVDCQELLDAWQHRHAPDTRIPLTRSRPYVSIHVPIRSEPPDVVARTLSALAALEYDDFEVLVVSNNTPDAAFWIPIERLCVDLGPRFHFFDIPHLPGFKAGALNFALRHTASAASVICTLDCDYEVKPEYLRQFVPAFGDPRVTFVQCPQDYRDWQDDPFLRMCYWEYWQFFGIGMVLRTRRNAAMLHGTMALVRKAALLKAGGWAEWCLTEDSECGIRLLAAGGTGLYTPRSFGRGLIPFGLADYLKQRRRWVIGGAQTTRRHLKLFLLPGGLSLVQRYLIVRSWAPWLRDACVVGALPLVIASAACRWLFERSLSFEPLMSVALAAVLGGHLLRQWVVCRLLLKLSWRDTAGAACAVLGLTWTIGHAWWRGIVPMPVPYFRTPKQGGKPRGTLSEARAETAVSLAMAGLAGRLLMQTDLSDLADVLALVQSIILMLPTLGLAWVARRSSVRRYPLTE